MKTIFTHISRLNHFRKFLSHHHPKEKRNSNSILGQKKSWCKQFKTKDFMRLFHSSLHEIHYFHYKQFSNHHFLVLNPATLSKGWYALSYVLPSTKWSPGRHTCCIQEACTYCNVKIKAFQLQYRSVYSFSTRNRLWQPVASAPHFLLRPKQNCSSYIFPNRTLLLQTLATLRLSPCPPWCHSHPCGSPPLLK